MAAQDGVSTFYGIPTKYVSLVTLVLQNSALVLTMRYSRTTPGPRYLSSTAVVLSEVLKCTICLAIHLKEQRSTARYSQLPSFSNDAALASSSSGYGLRQLFADLFGSKSGFFKLLIPAILYTLQNNLQFVAASNLDAATFQVTYQCKILTTALFAVLMLGQSLSMKKWLALVVLTAGVACVQIPSSTTASIIQQGNYSLGIIAVAVACLCSGFAGVYFEKVLKGHTTSIWVRNIQLSVGCLSIALTGALVWDGQAIREHGFFQGYSPLVMATVVVQAAGGLIVAMVIKYADNILKGFATSLSIIVSTVASIFLFNFAPTAYFLFGTVLVFLATYLYSVPDAPKALSLITESAEKTPPVVVEDYNSEKSSPTARSFRDETDMESGDDESHYAVGIYDPDEGRGSRNCSPSLIQKSTMEPQGLNDLRHLV